MVPQTINEMILGTFAHALFFPLLQSESISSQNDPALCNFCEKRGKCVKSMLFGEELRSSSTRERSLLLFSIRSRGHSLNVWLMVVLEHKLVVKVEPATSKICIHYKLGVGLAYVQEEAYDGLEVLTTPLGSGGRLAQGVAQGTPTPRPDPPRPLSSNALRPIHF